jgi:hypothetical protein
MGRRGDGGNVLLMAREAAANPRVRPRRRRELGLQALDVLWGIHQPPAGSRLGKFRTAFAKVEAAAADIGIGDDVFEQWADALRFVCDDRDDAVPW